MMRLVVATALLAGLLVVQPLAGRGVHAQNLANVVFSEVEKRLIRDYFRGEGQGSGEAQHGGKADKAKGKSGEMPPGLAKREQPTPGHQRQLQRNGVLPPGLEKRNLPSDLEGRLPRREGVDRLIVGSDVVLVRRATGLVLDILEDVIAR